MRKRTWRWLRVRIVGLATGGADTRLARVLTPPPVAQRGRRGRG